LCSVPRPISLIVQCTQTHFTYCAVYPDPFHLLCSVPEPFHLLCSVPRPISLNKPNFQASGKSICFKTSSNTLMRKHNNCAVFTEPLNKKLKNLKKCKTVSLFFRISVVADASLKVISISWTSTLVILKIFIHSTLHSREYWRKYLKFNFIFSSLFNNKDI